jgi:RNA polymerase sigma factor (sigma-70 family)
MEARWADLVRAIQAGDAPSEEEFARVFYPHVMALAVSRTRDREAALELTQEILMSVLQALRKGLLREPEKLPAFVVGTARNLINHRFQEMARHPAPVSFDPAVDPSPVAGRPCLPQESGIEEEERRSLARQAMAKLKPLDRHILFLILAEGLKPQEVALKVGLKPENVRNRKSRAIKMVQRKMARLIRSGEPGHI